ncbi:MAG: hypothetical protein CMJ33_08900 [Phycisphaerae bacterium]|nr:hypothetical protein [Phycisphaerae bacterium]
MTDRRRRGVHKTLGGAVLALAPMLLIGGCGEEEKPVVVKKAAPVVDNTPKVAPVTPVSELMKQYGIDSRIVLRESDAPGTDAERIAILKFFHSMITADAPQFSSMLSSQDRMEFMGLQETDMFKEAVLDIGQVDLQGGSSPDYQPAVVAIMTMQSTNDYPAQLWTYDVGENTGTPTFTSAPTPLSVMDKLTTTAQVDTWYRLLDEEMTRAMALDETIESLTMDLSQDGDTSASGAPDAPPSRGPAGPVTVPDRKPASPPKFVPGSS